MPIPSKSKAPNWSLDDHILYECSLARDEGLEWETIKAEDELFLASNPPDSQNKTEASQRIHSWVMHQRERHQSLANSAATIRASLKMTSQTLSIIGLIAGFAISLAALSYSGDMAINVSVFFALFVVLQLALTAGLAVFFFIPSSIGSRILNNSFSKLATFLFEKTLSWAHKLSSRALDQDQKNATSEISGIARSRLKTRSGLLKWIAFKNIQLPAVLFNIGVSLGLLSAVAFSDRAFGWQTTLDIEPDSIHSITKTIALPWVWFTAEGKSYPSIEQIEGSRIILKDGIQSLDSANLSSWWRFLAFGILFYGIIPRLVAALVGATRLNRICRDYDFKDAASQRLIGRLSPKDRLFTSDTIESESTPENSKSSTAASIDARPNQIRLCLIDKTILSYLNAESLLSSIALCLNASPDQIEISQYDSASINSSFSNLPKDQQIGIVFESWMPPIKETERIIASIRESIDDRSLIRIMLLGLPNESDDKVSLKVEPQHSRIWKTFVRSLADPYLLLEEQP